MVNPILHMAPFVKRDNAIMSYPQLVGIYPFCIIPAGSLPGER